MFSFSLIIVLFCGIAYSVFFAMNQKTPKEDTADPKALKYVWIAILFVMAILIIINFLGILLSEKWSRKIFLGIIFLILLQAWRYILFLKDRRLIYKNIKILLVIIGSFVAPLNAFYPGENGILGDFARIFYGIATFLFFVFFFYTHFQEKKRREEHDHGSHGHDDGHAGHGHGHGGHGHGPTPKDNELIPIVGIVIIPLVALILAISCTLPEIRKWAENGVETQRHIPWPPKTQDGKTTTGEADWLSKTDTVSLCSVPKLYTRTSAQYKITWENYKGSRYLSAVNDPANPMDTGYHADGTGIYRKCGEKIQWVKFKEENAAEPAVIIVTVMTR